MRLDGDGVSAPQSAGPGDLITIQITSGASEVVIVIPGKALVVLPVPANGRIRFRIPEDTPRGPSRVLISDMDPDNPSTKSVDIR